MRANTDAPHIYSVLETVFFAISQHEHVLIHVCVCIYIFFFRRTPLHTHIAIDCQSLFYLCISFLSLFLLSSWLRDLNDDGDDNDEML